MKNRDYSIDILKFLAVFLIINSHMDALYVKYSILATGGAIGDVLFLFASGYTLLLSKRNLRFDNWYKRRINRIYPSVLVCVVMGALLRNENSLTLSALWGGEFIVAIMTYYILIYWIKKYAIKFIPHIIAFTVSLPCWCISYHSHINMRLAKEECMVSRRCSGGYLILLLCSLAHGWD